MLAETQKLTPIQRELLLTYSTDISEEETKDIKKILASYFSQKSISEADKIYKEKNFNDETMSQWLDEK